nr:PhnD/SsuA/transferrin family substrate-binding protein [Paenibacillus illinoisensis]
MNRSQEQLATDITEATGIPAEIFVAEDYNMVIEALRAGKIEIGLIGPFGYIIATERANAKLLVRSEVINNRIRSSSCVKTLHIKV